MKIKTVAARLSLGDFDNEVNTLLKLGWYLYGSPTYDTAADTAMVMLSDEPAYDAWLGGGAGAQRMDASLD